MQSVKRLSQLLQSPQVYFLSTCCNWDNNSGRYVCIRTIPSMHLYVVWN